MPGMRRREFILLLGGGGSVADRSAGAAGGDTRGRISQSHIARDARQPVCGLAGLFSQSHPQNWCYIQPHHRQRLAQASVAESSVTLPPEIRRSVIPITPFLDGYRPSAKERRILGVAFAMVCIVLRIGGSDDGVKQAIATKIIDLAKAGERNPDILCDQALKEFRTLHGCRTWIGMCRGQARLGATQPRPPRPREPVGVARPCPATVHGHRAIKLIGALSRIKRNTPPSPRVTGPDPDPCASLECPRVCVKPRSALAPCGVSVGGIRIA